MAEKKESTKKLEREYVIPLRDKCRPVPRYKKTPKAIKTVKEFVARHMRIENRDLKKVRIDSYLNEQLWMRGIKKTLHKVKVKVVKEGDIVRVYATDLPLKLDFKKKRNEKRDKAAVEAAKAVKESQKTLAEKAKDQLKGKEEDSDKDGVEDKVEEKEKAKSVKEEGEKAAKEEAKAEKKTVKEKTPESKGKEAEVKN